MFAASTGSPKGEPWCAVGRARAATGYQEQRVIEIWVAAGEVRRQHRQPEGRAMVRGGPSSVATGYQEQRAIEIWVAAGEVRRQHRQPEGRAMVRGGPSSRGHPTVAGRLEVESRAPTVGRVGFHREASTSRPLGLRGITGKIWGCCWRGSLPAPAARRASHGARRAELRGHRLPGTAGDRDLGCCWRGSPPAPAARRASHGARRAELARPSHSGRSLGGGISGPDRRAGGISPRGEHIEAPWPARHHWQDLGLLLARFAASTGSPKGEPWCAVGRARAATGYQEQRVIEIWVAAGEVRRQHRQPEGRAMVRGGPSSVATGYQEQRAIEIWVAAGEVRRQHRQPEGRAMVRGRPSSRGHRLPGTAGDRDLGCCWRGSPPAPAARRASHGARWAELARPPVTRNSG